MIGSFEENVIEYCGPTLAGLKAGSCFTCFRRQFPDAQRLIRDVDRIACEKGVRLCVLADKQDYLLVYCYRPAMIDAILSRPEVIDFLDGMGYSIKEQDWLPVLSQRLLHEDFPHEIGIFLDYPLEDVMEFIRCHGQHCQFIGMWKVYHDPDGARQRFSCFRRCVSALRHHLFSGKSISQLIVSM